MLYFGTINNETMKWITKKTVKRMKIIKLVYQVGESMQSSTAMHFLIYSLTFLDKINIKWKIEKRSKSVKSINEIMNEEFLIIKFNIQLHCNHKVVFFKPKFFLWNIHKIFAIRDNRYLILKSDVTRKKYSYNKQYYCCSKVDSKYFSLAN